MKTGICNTTYTEPYGLTDGYEKMKLRGYDCADYQRFINTETVFFKSSTPEFERAIREERKIAEANGISFCQAHSPWRYPPRDQSPEDRAERMEAMKRSVYGTALLGCKSLVVHPIMPFGADSPDHPKRTWEMNLEFFSELCGYALSSGITVCLENMPFIHHPIARVSDIIGFVNELNRDNLRICLDTGHCAVFGDSPADAVKMIGKTRLAALHVHDNDGSADMHWCPYEGVIDWEDFSRALTEVGFEGVFSLECSPHRPQEKPEAWEKAELELARVARRLAGQSRRAD
ncbi:MAG: sugar phosphate isomerase/epimerase [Clostridia bacterium]|nr:sugar phosphate isomerase/epimerase [Clostridia bacterium]